MTDYEALIRDDPAEFLRRIRVGAEQGRLLAAARPSLAEVGDCLCALHDAFVEALWDTGRTDSVRRQILTPLGRARGAEWDKTTLNSNPDNKLVLEVADGYATAVRDHILAFARLAQAGGPVRSMLAIARVLLDASVHLSFLTDPSVDERDRCRRALNIRFEALRQEVADATLDASDAGDSESERTALMEAALLDGFEREVGGGRATRPPKEAWFVAPHDRFDSVASAAIGDDAIQFWRSLSSVVHAQERPAVRFPLGLGTVLPGPHATQMAMVHAVAPLLLAIDAMRSAEEFYGTQGASIDAGDAAARARAVVLGAAGLLDGEIRRRLGFAE